MWRNRAVESFIEWLREHNQQQRRQRQQQQQQQQQQQRQAAEQQPSGSQHASGVAGAAAEHAGGGSGGVGFYGMDVYSLRSSAEAVVDHLQSMDPQAAEFLANCYSCFDRYGGWDSEAYAFANIGRRYGLCERAAQRALQLVHERGAEWRARMAGDGLADEGAIMVEANALVAAGAERYYRCMFGESEESTWNMRDRHFLEVVKLIEAHLAKRATAAGDAASPPPRLVLWAHNSHVGDARHCDMGWRRHEVNVGQLVREAYPGEVAVVGFTTHTGTVSAADEWGDPLRCKRVNPSMPGSYEELLHSVGHASFALALHDPRVEAALAVRRPQRFIGVIYRPDTERWSHYSDSDLSRQYDLLWHVDTSHAVEPLDLGGTTWEQDRRQTHGDMPELFPFGL